MFARLFPVLAASLLLFSASSARADEDTTKYSVAYNRAIREALRAFSDRDWNRTSAQLDKAEKIAPPTVLTLNMRGAIACELRLFDEAVRYCNAALKLDPKFYPARFNLAEIEFMKGNQVAARTLFQKLIDENQKDDLARFRILLTYLVEKNDAEAKRILNQIPFPGDTPAYYYGNAAWEFAHGNEEEGKKWVARGNWTFKPEQVVNFASSFYDLGWMKHDPLTAPQIHGDGLPKEPAALNTEPVQPFSSPKSTTPAPATPAQN